MSSFQYSEMPRATATLPSPAEVDVSRKPTVDTTLRPSPNVKLFPLRKRSANLQVSAAHLHAGGRPSLVAGHKHAITCMPAPSPAGRGSGWKLKSTSILLLSCTTSCAQRPIQKVLREVAASKMPNIDRETFNPRYFTKYFTKNLALACGLIAISTFNYAFDQVRGTHHRPLKIGSTADMVPFRYG